MSSPLRIIVPLAAACAIGIASVPLTHVLAGQPDRPREPGQRGGGQGQPAGPGQRGGPPPSVGGGMRAMNRGVNQLKTTIGDPSKKEESLQAVWGIQRGCLSAKAAKPEHVEGDAAQKLETFRRGQVKLMAMLLELETAILDGKTAEAQAILAKVAEHRDASHKALGVDEDEDEGGGEGGGGGGG